MTGAVVVGVIIAVMFLVSFTEWFYHLALGLNEAVVRDVFWAYRIGTWVVGGLLFMGAVFWVLALNTECPLLEKDKPGIFKYMDCDVYWQVRGVIEGKSVSVLLEEAAGQLEQRQEETESKFFD